MMKTVTITLLDLITNFNVAMVDMNLNNEENMERIEEYTRDLRNLLSGKQDNVVGTIRRLFRGGFTMMLLNDFQFNALEVWNGDDEDFAVQVLDDKGTLCVVCKNELDW